MDSLGNVQVPLKHDTGECSTDPSVHAGEATISNQSADSNLVIVQQKPGLVVISQGNPSEDNDIKDLVEDQESQIVIRDDKIGQHLNTALNVRTSNTNSPDQLNDLQSYLVTFNKEIGHGGQPTPFSIGELDATNITSTARPIVFSDGQILNVSSSFHPNHGKFISC